MLTSRFGRVGASDQLSVSDAALGRILRKGLLLGLCQRNPSGDSDVQLSRIRGIMCQLVDAATVYAQEQQPPCPIPTALDTAPRFSLVAPGNSGELTSVKFTARERWTPELHASPPTATTLAQTQPLRLADLFDAWAMEQLGKTGESPMSSYFEAGWAHVAGAVAGLCRDTTIEQPRETDVSIDGGYKEMLTYVCSLIANDSFDRVRNNHEAGTWSDLRLAELHRLIREVGDFPEFSFNTHMMPESSKITVRNFYRCAYCVAALEAEVARFNVICAVGGREQGKSTVLGALFTAGSPVRASQDHFGSTDPLVTVQQPDKHAHRRKCDVVIDLPAATANDHVSRVVLESAAVVLVVHGCDRCSGDSDTFFPTSVLSLARGAQIFVFITKADLAFLDAAQETAGRGCQVPLFYA
jgi:hypothetical protein